MKRLELENKSKGIINTYLKMLQRMNCNSADIPVNDTYNASGLYYVKIAEISNIWELQERPLWDIMTEIFISLYSVGAGVSVIFSKTDSTLCIYAGSDYKGLEIVKNAFRGVLPQLSFEKNSSGREEIFTGNDILDQLNWSNGGYIMGNPSGLNNFNCLNQLERVLYGMQKKKWQISIFAQPVSKTDLLKKQHTWLTLASECSELSEVSYQENDNFEITSFKKTYFHSEQYYKKISEFCTKAEEGTALGEWATTINFATCDNDSAKLLGGLLTSAYFGEESAPEPIHAVYCPKDFFRRVYVPLNDVHYDFCDYPYPMYGSYLTSKELAVVCCPPCKDTAGITVKPFVSFDVNRDSNGDTVIGRIIENGDISDNFYSTNINEFNRHCLVIGLTGSGKTNTIKSLICSTAKREKGMVPFMIIEPAKKEYWELYKLGFENLKIYSIGSNEKNARRLCINPFQRVTLTDENGAKKSVSLQTHIDLVFAAFKASFIMYTPMPYVLEKAIYAIYEDCGWDIDRNINRTGNEIYPTMEDLYYKLPVIIEEMGYDTKMKNDLTGSLQARINSLRIGSKGSALNVKESFPMEHLLEGNTIIEIEDIGDDDIKAFIISLLLIRILEYRRQQTDCHKETRHLLFIEEAHRLLKNVQSGTGENADPRGAAVEFFCNMLAEMRSKGQGFVVADQIPSKLAPDLIKNTNLKIVHRTVAGDERELMGKAMNMTPEQIDAFSILKQGEAAVYSEGDIRPKLVKPPYANNYLISSRNNYSREEVLEITATNCIDIATHKGYEVLTDKKSAICRACCYKSCCVSPDDILMDSTIKMHFTELAAALDPTKNRCVVTNINERLKEFTKSYIYGDDSFRKTAKNCLLSCLIKHWQLDTKNPVLKQKLETVYINEIIKKHL